MPPDALHAGLMLLLAVLAYRTGRVLGDGPLLRLASSSHGSPRPFGTEKPTRVEEFNRTGVLHPEYQIPATLQPGKVSQFYYLSPRKRQPLALLISPCSGPISWTVNYVGPPEESSQPEGAKSKNQWPVKTLVPGSPLFTYEGDEARNFTVPRARAGLYRFEIKPLTATDPKSRTHPTDTVLLYATTNASHLPADPFERSRGKRRHTLRFQQRRSRRRLTVSWSKGYVDPHLHDYCVAVTSGSQTHPPTLCAAQRLLQIQAPLSNRDIPEGLHCVHQTRLALHGMKYNTTYNFTLYVINRDSNVSSRVASEVYKFRKTPALTLRTGHYSTGNLRKNDGFVNFRYRPRVNTSTVFHVVLCGGGIVRVKLRGPGVTQKKEVTGHAALTASPLPPGKRFMLRVSAAPQELDSVNAVKVVAAPEGTITYPKVHPRSAPWEHHYLRKCHEVTIGVEAVGTAKYCILVRELLESSSTTAIAAAVPDQCALQRRRRSEYTFEHCEEKKTPQRGKDLTFTVKRLQPDKAYLIHVTAHVRGHSLSYPLLGVRTRHSCQP